MVKWEIALDVIQDVRGTLGMYLFIIEEAIQTVGMACYLNWKEGNYSKVLEIANYVLDEIINPAIDFNNTYGWAAVPLNLAYGVFYKAAKTTMENYIEQAKQKLAGA